MTKKDKSVANKAKLILFIGIPLLLVLSLALIFGKKQYKEEEQFPPIEEEQEEVVSKQYPIEPEREIASRYPLVRFPKFPDPDKVIATCQSTGENLTSGVSTDCSNPVFEWESDADGFLVYFVAQLDKVNFYDKEAFQTSKTFSPVNLRKGQTYYLVVCEATKEKNPLWISGTGTGEGGRRSLFTYNYKI